MVQGTAKQRARNKAPVFVLGCGRSGTTLLYHMLLSAGNFAVYRSESNAINLLEPRFGDLSVKSNKEKLMEAWLASKLYQRSGLDAESITCEGHRGMPEWRRLPAHRHDRDGAAAEVLSAGPTARRNICFIWKELRRRFLKR